MIWMPARAAASIQKSVCAQQNTPRRGSIVHQVKFLARVAQVRADDAYECVPQACAAPAPQIGCDAERDLPLGFRGFGHGLVVGETHLAGLYLGSESVKRPIRRPTGGRGRYAHRMAGRRAVDTSTAGGQQACQHEQSHTPERVPDSSKPNGAVHHA
jgi:hypothetical protein